MDRRHRIGHVRPPVPREPDITVLGTTTDPSRTRGIAISTDTTAVGYPQRNILIFDTNTGALLSFEEVALADGAALPFKAPATVGYLTWLPPPRSTAPPPTVTGPAQQLARGILDCSYDTRMEWTTGSYTILLELQPRADSTCCSPSAYLLDIGQRWPVGLEDCKCDESGRPLRVWQRHCHR